MDTLDINTTFRKESISGISLSVLKSALQKYIRRSMFHKSLWSASRLDLFFHAPNDKGERIRTNFIHRLMIIFIEDIGVEGLKYWNIIDWLLNEICLVQRNRAKKSTRRSHVRDRSLEIRAIRLAIEIMTSQELPKARCCSDLAAVIRTDSYPEVVASSVFSHTNPLPFVKYLFSLPGDKPFDLLDQYHPNRGLVTLGRKWFKEIKTKEQYLTWCVILTDLVFNPDYRQTELLPINPDLLLGQSDNWNDQLLLTNQFEDYIHDRHTNSSTANRSLQFFAIEGAKVYPESKLVNLIFRNVYLKDKGVIVGAGLPIIQHNGFSVRQSTKREDVIDHVVEHDIEIDFDVEIDIDVERDIEIDVDVERDIEIDVDVELDDKIDIDVELDDEVEIDADMPKYESDFGIFKFRIQLTTTRNKTDVYLVEIDQTPYIVKGPFTDASVLIKYIDYQKEKQSLGMPITQNQIVYLVPNRWMEGVALGIRNVVDRNQQYPFLVVKSLIATESYKLRTHQSKLWPETIVIDPVATNLHLKQVNGLLSDTVAIDYLNILGFRCQYHLSDIALRNLLIVDNHMYSIDEESTKLDFSLLDELKINNFKKTQTLFKQYQYQVIPKFKTVLEKYLNV